MSSGGRGTYSIRIHLDAQQAISIMNQVRTQLGGLGASFTQANGLITQTAASFEKYNTAARQTVGTSSAMSSSLGQVRDALGQLNSQINTTAATRIVCTSFSHIFNDFLFPFPNFRRSGTSILVYFEMENTHHVV